MKIYSCIARMSSALHLTLTHLNLRKDTYTATDLTI